jgi:hypothetical protein
MVGRVELIPLSEGNRITVKENEKVIVGRGSSLGVCSLIISKIKFNHFYFSVTKKRFLVIMLNYYLKMIILFGLNQLMLILYFIVHRMVKQFNYQKILNEN